MRACTSLAVRHPVCLAVREDFLTGLDRSGLITRSHGYKKVGWVDSPKMSLGSNFTREEVAGSSAALFSDMIRPGNI